MFSSDNRYVCDAEIGSPKAGWRSCLQTATVECRREGMFLHYCEKHEARAVGNATALMEPKRKAA